MNLPRTLSLLKKSARGVFSFQGAEIVCPQLRGQIWHRWKFCRVEPVELFPTCCMATRAVQIGSFQGVDGKRMLACPWMPWMTCWIPKKWVSTWKVELWSLGCAPSSSSGCFGKLCPSQWPNKLCVGGTCWNLWTIVITVCVSTTWICIKYCDALCKCACATSCLECSTDSRACFHEKVEPLVCQT